MHFQNFNQGHIFELKQFKYRNPTTINTDIDPGHAFIKVSSEPGFRKAGPGCGDDSGYVGVLTTGYK